MHSITCSTQYPSLEGKLDNDNLTIYEISRRDELIQKGIAECREELGKQKSRDMYFFYEGAISGFEACKTMYRFSNYQLAIREEAFELDRELAKSQTLDSNPLAKEIREKLKIYDTEEKTDEDIVWMLKGKRELINFVYNRLRTIRLIQGETRKEYARIMRQMRK